MCENGKHFFYFVRLITFSYYSLLKEAILQKKKKPKNEVKPDAVN